MSQESKALLAESQSHKSAIKVLAGVYSHLEASLETNPILSSCRLMAASSFLQLCD